MTTVLFESPAGRVPSWRVERDGPTDPSLIWFIKQGRTTRWDYVARWAGGRWDPSRWVPDGKVPKDIMRQVVGQLVRREVAK